MNPSSNAFRPAIEALERELTDLERQAKALLTSINLLREKAGMNPRQSGLAAADDTSSGGTAVPIRLHSDTFTGKKLGSAVREYLEMRKASGADAPATSREIFDALKEGGFVSGAKDDATGMVVLRTMLRKNSSVFAKLQNGKYGLRAWYTNLRQPKGAVTEAADTSDDDMEDSKATSDEGSDVA